MEQVSKKATSGNLQAIKELVASSRLFEPELFQEERETPDRGKNRIVLAGILRRLSEESSEIDEAKPQLRRYIVCSTAE